MTRCSCAPKSRGDPLRGERAPPRGAVRSARSARSFRKFCERAMASVGGGIQAARQQNDGGLHFPGTSPHRTLCSCSLKAHRQPVRENPVRQSRWASSLRVARREQHLTPLGQGVLLQVRLAPVVVLTRADDEFHLIARREQAKILDPVARGLAGSRRLHVDHPHSPGNRLAAISIAPLVSSETSMARIAQAARAAPDSSAAPAARRRSRRREAFRSRQPDVRIVVDVVPFTGVKGVLGVAVLASQRAAGQPHEHRAKADRIRFPLQRVEDFIDAQPIAFGRCLRYSSIGRRSSMLMRIRHSVLLGGHFLQALLAPNCRPAYPNTAMPPATARLVRHSHCLSS